MSDHKPILAMINRVLETMHTKIFSGQFRFPDDVKSLQRQAEIAESINEHSLAGWVLNSIGVAYTIAGDFEQAELWYGKALGIFEGVKDYKHAASSLNNLGELRRMSGKLEAAADHYQLALGAATQAEDAPENTATDLTLFGVRCTSYLNLGIVYSVLHRFDEAQAALETAYGLLQEATRFDKSKGQLSAWVEANRLLAEVALHRGDIAKAWSYIALADESAQSQAHYMYLADIALTKGHIASHDPTHETLATTYYSTAREYIKRLGHDSHLARFLLAEAHYQQQEGAAEIAKAYASEALALCTTLNMRDEAAFAQTLMG